MAVTNQWYALPTPPGSGFVESWHPGMHYTGTLRTAYCLLCHDLHSFQEGLSLSAYTLMHALPTPKVRMHARCLKGYSMQALCLIQGTEGHPLHASTSVDSRLECNVMIKVQMLLLAQSDCMKALLAAPALSTWTSLLAGWGSPVNRSRAGRW